GGFAGRRMAARAARERLRPRAAPERRRTPARPLGAAAGAAHGRARAVLASAPRARARPVPGSRDLRALLEPGVPRRDHVLERRGLRAPPVLRAPLRRGGRAPRRGGGAVALVRGAHHLQRQVLRRAVPRRARAHAGRPARAAALPPGPAPPRPPPLAGGAARLPAHDARAARLPAATRRRRAERRDPRPLPRLRPKRRSVAARAG